MNEVLDEGSLVPVLTAAQMPSCSQYVPQFGPNVSVQSHCNYSSQELLGTQNVAL